MWRNLKAGTKTIYQLPMENTKNQRFIIRLVFFCCLFSMIFLLLKSEGTPLHDEIGHYLISRDVFHAPQHILDTWGRTLNTLLYCIPAQSGLNAARFLSLLLAFITALLTIKVSEMLGIKNAATVTILLFFQPWFMDLSYLCITEVPFSLLMVLGVYLFLKNRFFTASIIIGLLPLIRHEGIVLTGLWALYAWRKKEWRSIAGTFIPLILYNFIYYWIDGAWPFAMYFEAKPNLVYGRGTWYHFLIRLPHPRAAGIPIMVIAACSIIPVFRSALKTKLILAWYFSYFLLHTVIFRFGLFASGGYKLFLLPLAPAIAIAATLGLHWMTDTIKSGFSLKSGNSIYRAVCVACIIFALIFVRPYALDNEGMAIKNAIEWIRKQGLEKNGIISTHVYFYHLFPKKVPPKTIWEKFPTLSTMPAGTLFLWDNHYSDEWGFKYSDFISNITTWELLQEFEKKTVVIFRKKQ